MAVSNSIVVVNFNAKASLATMLTALRMDEAVTTEVIVVDNMSFDGSADLVRQKFPAVRLIGLEENRGFAAAVNRALREASGDVAIICHSDIATTVHVLTDLADRVREGRGARRVAAAVPRLIGPDKSEQPSCCRFPGAVRGMMGAFSPAAARRCVAPSLEHVTDLEWASCACLALDLEALVHVGEFDEKYFLFYEDADLFRRLHEKNYRILVARDLTVIHEKSMNAPVPPHLARLMRKSMTRYFHKHGTGLQKAMVNGALTARGWLKTEE